MGNLLKLVQGPYLHGSKWNFFYQAGSIPELDDNNAHRLNTVIKQLESERERAKVREEAFFSEFGTKGETISQKSKNWSNQFLISSDKSKESKSQKILRILDDRYFADILSGLKDEKNLVKHLQNTINETLAEEPITEITPEVLNDINNYLTSVVQGGIQDGIKDVISNIGILGTTKNSNTIIKESKVGYKLQKALIQNGKFQNSKTRSRKPRKGAVKIPKPEKRQVKDIKTLRSKDSRLLKNIIDIASKQWATSREIRISTVVKYFEKRLAEENFSKEEIKKYSKIFEDILIEDNKEKGYLFMTFNKVNGELQEKAMLISRMSFSNPYGEEQWVNTKQVGQELVKRMDHDVQSKIDTIIYGPKTNTPYYIQQKASKSKVFEEFDKTGSLEDLDENIAVSIKLGDEIDYSTLVKQFKYTKVMTDSDIDLLSYMIVNYNALWKFSDLNKSTTKEYRELHSSEKELNQSDGAFRTAEIIDQILSKGIKIFVSDFISDEMEDFQYFQNWDFLIFKNRWLIPLSTLLNSILEFIQDRKKTSMTLRSTSYIKETMFNQNDFKDMSEAKLDARREEEKKFNKKEIKYDYHNENLVEEGIKGGRKALSAIKIKNIAMRAHIKNLVANGII